MPLHPTRPLRLWRSFSGNRSIFILNLRLLELTTPTEDRIMPYHVSPGGQEAKCQVDVSQRKYKGALASRKQLTNRVEELLMQFMQISTRNSRRCVSGFVKTRRSSTLTNARHWFSRESPMPLFLIIYIVMSRWLLFTSLVVSWGLLA